MPKGNIRPVRIKADPPQYPAASRRRLHERSNSAEPAFRRPWGILRPSETSLSPDTQSPPSHRFQTAKQLETRQSMVKSVVFSVSSVIHF
ncbi:hypothetical protein [Neisseria elongata]|uniref:hypothetical protein n=1 Tax=Neisseria elongata TaxID=495 RepID=UPI00131C8AB4|nr:hypothetical protein [Neisseria elongata]